MIESGEHLIQFYTKKGAKIKDLTEVTSQGLIDAKEIAEETIIIEKALESEMQPASFTIDRRIFNSLDNQDT